MTAGGRPENHDRVEARAFEEEVRRITGLLYPDVLGGPTLIDGIEHDGVFVTSEMVVIVEATISKEKAKAESDGRKLKARADKFERTYPYKGIKAFFVTRDDPTGPQLDQIRKIGSPVTAMSYRRLRSQLIDVPAYLEARSLRAFGSARDLETDGWEVTDRYVGLDFVDPTDRHRQYGTHHIIDAIRSGQRVVVLGDYGAGKSMTLREVHQQVSRGPADDGGARFCLHLNLNDHLGQHDPIEALTRHAGLIGFDSPSQLVRAWRYGDAHVLLDGFDEVFMPALMGPSRSLGEIRRQNSMLVKHFLQQTPRGSGVLVAGREHYFDSLEELRHCLGLRPDDLVVSANEFTERQVEQYLASRRWAEPLPQWLPRRPLIIGYLASRALFDVFDEASSTDPGVGWDRLLSALSRRESNVHPGLDHDAIRAIIERLATRARKTSSGLGPVQFEDHVSAFRDVQGYFPDEGAYIVLQRLPGLRVSDGHVNSRVFVDDGLVDAARAGDVLRWVTESPGDRPLDAYYDWQSLLQPAGMSVLLHGAQVAAFTAKQVQNALDRTRNSTRLDGLAVELVRLMLAMGWTVEKATTITDQHIPALEIPGSADASQVSFSGCLIDVLDIADHAERDRLPGLYGCSVDSVLGVTGVEELRSDRMVDCEFGSFADGVDNMSAILRLGRPDYTVVALTVLRKVFAQHGHARKEGALYRGSLTVAQRALIPEVLKNLKASQAIRKIRRRDATLWESNRSMVARVMMILDTAATTEDPLVVRSKTR